MTDNREQEILEKMMEISELIEQGREDEKTQIGTINYYKEFNFQGSNWQDVDIYVAKIENTAENTNTYEIYSGRTNTLIATVDEQGKLHFMPEYIENLRNMNPRIVENLEDLDFELPRELAEEDRVLTRQEREDIKSQEEKTGTIEKEGKEKEQGDVKKEEQEQEQLEKSPEEEQQEEIAKVKKVPSHNVLIIRENSNLYKDHPNLEPNLYFYRDNDGAVRAEYLDSNGQPQPSQYFEPSTTSLRQETVSLGDDGNPVTKEVPYQVMRTKGLNNVDKDIRDIRVNIKIDTYGYMDIEEARQGKNGDWLSHDIEVKGRNYNTHAVNETTSIRNRTANPDEQTEAYENVESTGLEEDGIQYSEMYLISHSDELIDALVKEGYQRPEAVEIFNYMIGEEALTLKEAKERVNEEIGNNERINEKTAKKDRKKENDFMDDDEENDGGRTQGGDAWERLEGRVQN